MNIETKVSKAATGRIGDVRVELYDSTLGKPTLTLNRGPDHAGEKIVLDGEQNLKDLADTIYQFLGTGYTVNRGPAS